MSICGVALSSDYTQASLLGSSRQPWLLMCSFLFINTPSTFVLRCYETLVERCRNGVNDYLLLVQIASPKLQCLKYRDCFLCVCCIFLTGI